MFLTCCDGSLSIVSYVSNMLWLCVTSGEVQAELPDGGQCRHGGQALKDSQGGVAAGEPPLYHVLPAGERIVKGNVHSTFISRSYHI